jgi:hypothetical protein
MEILPYIFVAVIFKHQLMRYPVSFILSVLLLIFIRDYTSAQNAHPVTQGLCILTNNYEVNDEFIHIEWNTTHEINLRFFLLQRSMDGFNYEVVSTVPATNNYTRPAHYEFDDAVFFTDSVTEISYRLLAIDMDGRHNQFWEWPVKLEKAALLSKE